MAAVLGLLIGTMGIDSLPGQARFTFDQVWLLGGLDLIVVLVGLYAYHLFYNLLRSAT